MACQNCTHSSSRFTTQNCFSSQKNGTLLEVCFNAINAHNLLWLWIHPFPLRVRAKLTTVRRCRTNEWGCCWSRCRSPTAAAYWRLQPWWFLSNFAEHISQPWAESSALPHTPNQQIAQLKDVTSARDFPAICCIYLNQYPLITRWKRGYHEIRPSIDGHVFKYPASASHPISFLRNHHPRVNQYPAQYPSPKTSLCTVIAFVTSCRGKEATVIVGRHQCTTTIIIVIRAAARRELFSLIPDTRVDQQTRPKSTASAKLGMCRRAIACYTEPDMRTLSPDLYPVGSLASALLCSTTAATMICISRNLRLKGIFSFKTSQVKSSPSLAQLLRRDGTTLIKQNVHTF